MTWTPPHENADEASTSCGRTGAACSARRRRTSCSSATRGSGRHKSMAETIIQGDAMTVLKTMPSDHFHCVVTSPPYWGLRDYGTGAWEGGDPACDHLHNLGGTASSTLGPASGGHGMSDAARELSTTRSFVAFRDVCGKCGARRVDQQIGLEATPEEWVARLVEVFREVRRVLRPDGTLWLNIGDSYAQYSQRRDDAEAAYGAEYRRRLRRFGTTKLGLTLRRQDGVRVVIDVRARQAAASSPRIWSGSRGCWRSRCVPTAGGCAREIIWAKPNPMPESVRDRPTKAHEQVFLLTKSPRYFYDAEAVREGWAESSLAAHAGKPTTAALGNYAERIEPGRQGETRSGTGFVNGAGRFEKYSGRNLRSVWTIATDPLPSVVVDGEKLDHFASYPVELARRCILAGSPKDGHVLDLFGGSGRTALAAEELDRDCTLIELNPKSCAMAKAQIERAKARRMIGDVDRREVVSEDQMRFQL